MKRIRTAAVAFIGFVLVGCSQNPHASSGSSLSRPEHVSYPVRQDLLVLAIPPGTPPRYPSPGFTPMISLQYGARTLNTDFVTQLKPGLGKTLLDPRVELSEIQRDDIGRMLDGYFGGPLAPTVRLPSHETAADLARYEFDPSKGAFANLRRVMTRYSEWDEGLAAIRELNLSRDTLYRGGVLYRRWCLHCHGVTGGGDGSQAAELGAVPRDYRQGLFKYGSSYPSHDQPRKGEKGKLLLSDLKKTIRHGLEGSMMPAFPHLTDDEVTELAGYVIHLAARGEVEFEVMARIIRLLKAPNEDDPEYSYEYLQRLVDHQTILVIGNWGRANRSPIPIPTVALTTDSQRWESIIRGYKAFVTRGCMGCHDNYGRIEQLKYDAWGTVVRPRDLTLGVFRGGRTGVDLYARIYAGIVPSTMPDYVANLKSNQFNASPVDEVWDIVHFLQVLADSQGRRQLDGYLRKEREQNPSLNIVPLN